MRLFSPSVLSLRFQQGLINLSVLWEARRRSLRACVGGKLLRRPLPSALGAAGRLSGTFVRHMAVRHPLQPCGVCATALPRVLLHGILLALPAPFL